MLTSLKVIYEMLESINQKSDNKEDILKKYLNDPIFGSTLRKVLDYITNQDLKFPLKRINYCLYFDDKIAAEHQNVDSIFEMLDYISIKQSDPSDEERTFLERISSSDVETVETVMRILNKMSGCGLTNEQIMKVLQDGN